eukprot:CAMPEP_0172153170 /NCGR_PEP_ID=MMETSP1050-20130122/1276_1 /TAXON_ID=233186 /ORGANISM="Cryptomonas curvata, Strain CCAP979/52" /LENGTH=353 /DNA_ID=CAMNT_0012821637 /DNA_START=95 /DNA_END=1153 /DNA_ORIENTATION=+
MVIVAQYDEAIIANANMKGFELCRIGRTAECVEQYSISLKLYSNQSTVYFHLGSALRSLNQLHESVSAYESSVQLAETSGDSKVMINARFQLGMTKIDQGQWDAAIVEFDRILAMDRNVILPEALYRLTYLQHFACNFTRREKLLRDVKETVSWELSAGTSKMTPSQALMLLDSPHLYDLSRMYSDGHLLAARQLEGHTRPWFWNLGDFLYLTGFSVSSYGAYSPQHLSVTDGRLRIGYISKDFGFSSVGQLLPRLFSGHDRRRFKVSAYSVGDKDGSWYEKEVEEAVQHWVHLAGVAPQDIAARINTDAVNILIDLSGHFSVSAQVALAMQPAAVAVSYLGWLSTTGAPYIQ